MLHRIFHGLLSGGPVSHVADGGTVASVLVTVERPFVQSVYFMRDGFGGSACVGLRTPHRQFLVFTETVIAPA